MADINAAAANQQLSNLAQEVQALTNTLRSMLTAQSNIASAQEANRRRQIEANEQLFEFRKNLIGANKLSDKQLDLLNKAYEAKKKELLASNNLAKAQEELTRVVKSGADPTVVDKYRKAVNNASVAHQDAAKRTKSLTETFQKSMGGFVKNIDFASMAVSWFGTALTNATKQAVAQNKANGGLIEGTNGLIAAMAEQQNQAWKYAVDGATFAKITNEARQMLNAMGGTAKGMEQLNGAVDRFSIMTGSFEEGLRLATKTAADFATKGIKPTAQGMEQYQNDLVALRRQTGLTVEQAHQMYNDIASDADSIDMLRSARKDEREAILQSQRALIQQSIAAGMSAEQAKEAAKMLNKMVAAKPLDRLKQAAKVRALSGAMGIAGGDEAAAAITAGKRATPQQQKALQEFSQNAANKMDSAAGQGLGTEIFATSLLEKLDLEQYYGKSSAFSTTLGDSLRPLGDISKQYIDVSKDGTAQTISQLAKIYEQISLIVTGTHWSGLLVSGVAAIAAVLARGSLAKLGGSLASTIGNTANKVGATVGGAASAVGKAGAGAAAAVGAGASKLATVGKVAGVAGSALDVGLGLNDLAQGKKQESMSGLDMLSPMRWGMYAGDKINKGVENVTGGSSIGSKLYDWFGPKDPNITAPTPIPTSKTNDITSQTKALKEANTKIENATVSTADGVQQQVKKADTTNDLLKTMVDLQQKNITLAEKQLVASTLTDKEKADTQNRSNLRSDNKFGSQYNYV